MSIVAVLAGALFAAAGAAREAGRIGDFGYDPALWSLEPVGEGYRIRPLAADRGDVTMILTMRPGAAWACRLEDLPDDAPSHYGRTRKHTIAKPGFDIHVAQIDYGCRNRRPLSVFACAAYKDRVYRFDGPINGCRGGGGENPMTAFLDGLRAL